MIIIYIAVNIFIFFGLFRMIYDGLCHPGRFDLWPIFLVTERQEQFPADYLDRVATLTRDYENKMFARTFTFSYHCYKHFLVNIFYFVVIYVFSK